MIFNPVIKEKGEVNKLTGIIISEDGKLFKLCTTNRNDILLGEWIPIEHIEEYKHLPSIEKNKDGSSLYSRKNEM